MIPAHDVENIKRWLNFGHPDNLRLVFQTDVDEPVFPAPAGGMLNFPGAIQNPDGTCNTMDENTIAGELIQKYWKIEETS